MSPPTNLPRRRFLVGGMTLAATGAVVGWARWMPTTVTAAEDPQPIGPVTIVAFDDDGRQLGKRTLPRVVKTPAEWRAALTSAQYYILRERGTERPFSGKYVNESGICPYSTSPNQALEVLDSGQPILGPHQRGVFQHPAN